jgi:hypothetical protein
VESREEMLRSERKRVVLVKRGGRYGRTQARGRASRI